eukprot:GILI01010721.1.p1 GENE.GILI01010721.1~~GILI01010721.1.p1  ORF type:complete len:472 (+),score=53.35 GILI01010721.1:62-1477(+)
MFSADFGLPVRQVDEWLRRVEELKKMRDRVVRTQQELGPTDLQCRSLISDMERLMLVLQSSVPRLLKEYSDEDLLVTSEDELRRDGRDDLVLRWRKLLLAKASTYENRDALSKFISVLPQNLQGTAMEEWGKKHPAPSITALVDVLTAQGMELSEKDVRNLFDLRFFDYQQMAAQGKLGSKQFLSIRHQLNNMMRTSTRHEFSHKLGFVFDGPISGAKGQAETSIVYAIKGSSVYCAKIGPASVREEKVISDSIHSVCEFCPTVVPILHCLDVPGERGPRVALLMPVFPLTVADALLSMPTEPVVRSVLAFNVAVCTLSAIKAFSLAGLSHGDIKPNNLMLHSADSSIVTLVDFGTARKFGDYFEESSHFNLNQPRCASTGYDLVCLGSTLATILCLGQVLSHSTVETMSREVEKKREGLSALPTSLANVCLACLQARSEGDSDLEAICQMLLEIPTADGFVSFDSVWPRG